MPKVSTKNKKTATKKKKSTTVAKKSAPKGTKGDKGGKVTKKAAARTTARKGVKKSARSSVATAPKAAKRKRKVSFKREITEKLLAARAKILQEVSQKVRSETDANKREIGDIYDIASSERERELALMFGDRDREKLSQIEDALERINLKSYGECGECGEPIAENRLRALPFTRVCVECQSKHERDLRIRGRFEEEPAIGIMERSGSDDDEF